MATPDPSASHTSAAQRRLLHLSAIAGRTAADEGRILAAARDRWDRVETSMASLRPRVDTDPDAASRYQALVLERGQLQQIISQAQKVLA